jgi:hypothetical protein
VARQDRKKKGGRVTAPKGGSGSGSRQAIAKGRSASGPEGASSRYTAPIPQEFKVSPTWVPVLMFAFLILGMLLIITNYLGILPGGTDNLYLLVGLGCILGGIITATNLH